MREPGEEDEQLEPVDLAGFRDELVGEATLQASIAAGRIAGGVLVSPKTAGIAWATGSLVDGRFVQVTIHIGRRLRLRPELREAFIGPPAVTDAPRRPVEAADIDLPHSPDQGELLL